MKYLDANIVIRYLTKDDQRKALACFELFQRLKRGDEQVETNEAVMAEVVYVLSSKANYNLPNDEIRARLLPIISLKGLKLKNKKIYLRALDLYVQYKNLDFEDVLSLAFMERKGIKQIYSYDSDFDRITNMERVEP